MVPLLVSSPIFLYIYSVLPVIAQYLGRNDGASDDDLGEVRRRLANLERDVTELKGKLGMPTRNESQTWVSRTTQVPDMDAATAREHLPSRLTSFTGARTRAQRASPVRGLCRQPDGFRRGTFREPSFGS